jgi:hypothetical protein
VKSNNFINYYLDLVDVTAGVAAGVDGSTGPTNGGGTVPVGYGVGGIIIPPPESPGRVGIGPNTLLVDV